jgi:DNA-binding HxlR family transcriptional regulator
MQRTHYDRWSCPTQKAVEEIGDKWTLFIIREFIFGKQTMGFNELLRALSPISSRTLALKLKKLQKQNILTRKVVQKTPARVEYRITPQGQALKKSLLALADWYKINIEK